MYQKFAINYCDRHLSNIRIRL